MIFPDVAPEEWAKKHKMPIKIGKCGKCKKDFPMNVPIMMEGCAGFSTKIHECGEGFWEVILTPRTDKAKEFWNSVVR